MFWIRVCQYLFASRFPFFPSSPREFSNNKPWLTLYAFLIQADLSNSSRPAPDEADHLVTIALFRNCYLQNINVRASYLAFYWSDLSGLWGDKVFEMSHWARKGRNRSAVGEVLTKKMVKDRRPSIFAWYLFWFFWSFFGIAVLNLAPYLEGYEDVLSNLGLELESEIEKRSLLPRGLDKAQCLLAMSTCIRHNVFKTFLCREWNKKSYQNPMVMKLV